MRLRCALSATSAAAAIASTRPPARDQLKNLCLPVLASHALASGACRSRQQRSHAHTFAQELPQAVSHQTGYALSAPFSPSCAADVSLAHCPATSSLLQPPAHPLSGSVAAHHCHHLSHHRHHLGPPPVPGSSSRSSAQELLTSLTVIRGCLQIGHLMNKALRMRARPAAPPCPSFCIKT